MPGKAAVLCYFSSQGNSVADHQKLMKSFRAAQAMKDLPASVRKLIVNFNSVGGIGGMELERSATTDTILRSMAIRSAAASPMTSSPSRRSTAN